MEWQRERGFTTCCCLVSRQMKDANTIDTVARNALNTSREALRLAEETLRMPDTNRAEIERLTREWVSLQGRNLSPWIPDVSSNRMCWLIQLWLLNSCEAAKLQLTCFFLPMLLLKWTLKEMQCNCVSICGIVENILTCESAQISNVCSGGTKFSCEWTQQWQGLS